MIYALLVFSIALISFLLYIRKAWELVDGEFSLKKFCTDFFSRPVGKHNTNPAKFSKIGRGFADSWCVNAILWLIDVPPFWHMDGTDPRSNPYVGAVVGFTMLMIIPVWICFW
ncbi:hypothetical protein CL634_01030 [bacterium]|nr:hypothetical protein [bacterium]|tara:strand:+ start:588 stop:926 length:339 start_codon:yes stop_codon:yes gene_type:complete